MADRFSKLTPRSKFVRISSEQPEKKAEEKKEEKKRSKLTSMIPQLPLKNLGTSERSSRAKKPIKAELSTKKNPNQDSEFESSEKPNSHSNESLGFLDDFDKNLLPMNIHVEGIFM
jgi:hypothetical protein